VHYARFAILARFCPRWNPWLSASMYFSGWGDQRNQSRRQSNTRENKNFLKLRATLWSRPTKVFSDLSLTIAPSAKRYEPVWSAYLLSHSGRRNFTRLALNHHWLAPDLVRVNPHQCSPHDVIYTLPVVWWEFIRLDFTFNIQ